MTKAVLALCLAAVPLVAAPESRPQQLTDRGLQNLTAFTKLFGYVRHFHPSDAVEKVDWSSVAIAGVKATEGASSPDDLAKRLQSFFKPIAPTVQVFVTGQKPTAVKGLVKPEGEAQIVSWENVGFGGGLMPAERSPYHSKRVFKAAVELSAPFEADLGASVSCKVPLTLYAKDNSAIPATTVPKEFEKAPENASGDDRTTRLADIVLVWNVYQHFYPYFDIVKTDWSAVLAQSLKSAATDKDKFAFQDTLKRLVASAKDGHGYVGSGFNKEVALPPFDATWIEGKFIVSSLQPEAKEPSLGDEIVEVDGKSVETLWKQKQKLISGATEQWVRYRAETEILVGEADSDASFKAKRPDGTAYDFKAKRVIRQTSEVRGHKPIEELQPGFWYVDLDGSRAKMDEYKAAIPDLAKAKGIVFDLRGYPNSVAMDVIQRLSDTPITSAHWEIPKFSKPDRVDVEFEHSRWPPMGPLEPRFKAKVAFLTDGRAISYAESIMGIVEHYKLGEIVGEPTAGTNGNVNPFSLPGGYTIVFTGMKVTKHDDSTHHGVGIKPTVTVHRTVAGIAAKKDEVLERALKVVGG